MLSSPLPGCGPCPAVAPAASLSELENPSPTSVLRKVWTFLGAGVARPLRRGSPGPIPHAAQRGGCAWLGCPHGPQAGGLEFPQHKMCLCKLTVGVTSTSAGRGGARPVITLPGEAREERGAGRPASPGSGGSEPGLCWEATGSACSWAWTTALWPEPGMGMGSSPLPPFSCQPGETGLGEFIALRGCALYLPHPQLLAPWARCTPSLAVPLGRRRPKSPLCMP